MKKPFIITLIVSAIISVGAFYWAQLTGAFSDPFVLAIDIAIFIPQLVAIWAFLTSLGIFKRQLKIAYYIIALGIFCLSLNQLQLFLHTFITFDPIILAWFITGSTLMGSLLLYLGLHTFARTLAFKKLPWTSFWLAAAFSLVLVAVSTFIPHIPYPIDEWMVDGIFGIYVAGGGFGIMAAVLAWNIRSRLAPSYRTAMSWLTAAAAVLAFAAFHETAIRLLPVFNQESFYWYSIYGVSLWPLFLVAILLLGASLSFRKLSKDFAELPENASYLDVINYTAQLVSNPQAIDVALDKMREVTARQSNPQELSAADQTALLTVYKQLEEYLVTKESLVKITREDLRSRLPSNFRQKLDGEKMLN